MRSCCSLPQVPLLLPPYKPSLQNWLGVIPRLPFFSSLMIFHVNHFCSLSDLLVLPAVGRNARLAWGMLYSGADPQETIELCSAIGSQQWAGLGLSWQGHSAVSEMATRADCREPFGCPQHCPSCSGGVSGLQVVLPYPRCFLNKQNIPVSLYCFFAPGGKKKVVFLGLKAYGIHICSFEPANTRTHPGIAVLYMA